jgi:hypothetical protein
MTPAKRGNPALTVLSPAIEALIWLIAWTLPPAERREVHKKDTA